MMTKVDKSKIGIRADGNTRIGMGHLMRCMSIAKALEKQGVECLFFTACSQAGLFLAERGFACQVLGTEAEDMEAELTILEPILKKENISLMLIDSYQVTQKYLDTLRKTCPVFYLDDMGRKHLKADGIINYNIYGQDLCYEAWCPADTKLLLGAGYAPVKEEFTEVSYEVRDRVSRILITMGGSDGLNIAGSLGQRLLEHLPREIGLDIICGRFNPHLDKLLKMAEQDSRIHVYVDVQDMWNRMAAVDVAISAAGSTMYELCAVGVPTVCCYYVDNQRAIAEGFAEKVQMVNGGDYSVEEQAVLLRITEEVCRLTDSLEARRDLSGRMKKVTDGHGAERIARELKRIV